MTRDAARVTRDGFDRIGPFHPAFVWGAVVVFERGSDEPDPELPGYERLDARDYGAARVLFLRLEA